MHSSVIYQSGGYTYTGSTFGLGEGGNAAAHEDGLAKLISIGVKSSSSMLADSTQS